MLRSGLHARIWFCLAILACGEAARLRNRPAQWGNSRARGTSGFAPRPPPRDDPPGAQTFGYTYIGDVAPHSEKIVAQHPLSANATSGLATFFWFTGAFDDYQDAIITYYIDNAYTIQFLVYEGHGIGFHDETIWGNTRTGKGSAMGGVYNTYQIPFYKNLTVTLRYPPGAVGGNAYINIRGVENVPVVLGDVVLPPTAQLRLWRNINVPLKALDYIDLFETPANGAVLGFYLSVETTPPINFWEGCFRVYDIRNRTAVKWWLSTGTEDFFQSGWGFSCAVGNCQTYRYPEAGLTHTDGQTQFAAYKLFEQDRFFFQDGCLVRWRFGETMDQNGHKCYGWGDPNGRIVGNTVTPGTVTTYAWVYVW